MNRSYRSLFNATLGTWVAAPETAKGHAKTGKSKAVLAATAALLALGSNGAWALDGNALPKGGTVTAGSGTLSSSGNTLTVNQTTGKLAIDWQSFNIGQNATVNFVQPGNSSIALNRVIGSDASQIYGRLNANGQVFLLNANGVLFGKGSEVNVGGLVASTLNLSNADFLAGNYRFTGTAGSVINRGSISAADGGYVALLGGQVSNQGTLVAKLGNVSLAAGRDITLDFAGDGLINLQVNQGTVNALAENKQLIRADGGAVLMTAKAADSLIQAVVNNEGVIEARGIDTSGGTIKLLADMDNGTVKVGGTLDASAQGSKGGFIETSGHSVSLHSGAMVKAKNWLIDPTDITIDAAAASAIVTSLNAGTNVTETTSSGGTDAGNITVASAVAWIGTGALTLTADNNIAINAAITGANGGLTLSAGNSISAPAAVNVGTFDLQSGTWNQVGSSLPSFSATDFRISGGTFIRALAGNGSSGSPYALTDIYGVQGIGSSGMLGKSYTLANDIDASATSTWNSNGSGGYYGFTPIGDPGYTFRGIFDGLGHTISGLTINRPGTNYVGLFGYTNNTIIRNIGLVGGSVTGYDFVGGLVGFNASSISNAYATGSVTGYNNVGGLVGYNDYSGGISNAYATGSVTGSNTVGGLAGFNASSISNAYATGSVKGDYEVGGLAGSNLRSISNAYATGSVTGNFEVGGLAGFNLGSISNAYFDTTVNPALFVCGNFGCPNTGGASSTALKSAATFASWDISDAGGSSSVWRIYEGSTTPLLRSFLTPLTISASGGSKTYDGSTDASAALTYSTAYDSSLLLGTLLASTASKNVGTYSVSPAGLYSGQQGYDISYVAGNVTIAPRAVTLTAPSVTKTYDGGTTYTTRAADLSALSNQLVGGDTVTAASIAYTNKNAGSGNKTVTLGGLTLDDGNNGGNYTVTAAGNSSSSIDKLAVTLTAPSVTKTYDGTTTYTTSTADLAALSSQLVGGDTVTAASIAYTNKNAGSGNKTVTLSGLTLDDGSNGGNYTITAAGNSSSTIQKATLTLTASSGSKVYDGTTSSSATVGVSGLQSGDSLSGLTESYASKNVLGAGASTLNVDGNYRLADGNNGGNYIVVTQSATGTITKASATVTANSGNTTYNGLIQSISGFTAAGLVNGETTSVLSGVTTSGAGKNAGTYTTTASGTDGNYNLIFVDGRLTINKANATVTANSGNAPYNGLTQSVSGFTASGLVNGETASVLSGVSAGGSGRNAGTYTTTASGTDGNYNLTFVDGALTIQKAQLTVTADNKTRLYGQSNPTFTETITGFVNGENASSALITGSATGSSMATISSAPGSYTITGNTGNLAAANYYFTAANGTLTISESVSTKPTYQAAVIDAHNAGRGLPAASDSFADNGRSGSGGQFITVVDGGIRLPTGLE